MNGFWCECRAFAKETVRPTPEGPFVYAAGMLPGVVFDTLDFDRPITNEPLPSPRCAECGKRRSLVEGEGGG